MKWAYSIRRKISVALLMAAIFVLLFVKNMMDSSNVSQLGTSFSSVYEDRLLVESYIYKMSDHLFRKKIMMDTAASPATALKIKPAIDQYNETIAALIAAYEKTKLTKQESVYLEDLKGNIGKLTELEGDYFRSAERGNEERLAKALINAQFNQASRNLELLSAIQVSEGKQLNDLSQRIVAGSSILTKFEIGILVAIGLMIIALVFESSSVLVKTPGNSSLN